MSQSTSGPNDAPTLAAAADQAIRAAIASQGSKHSNSSGLLGALMAIIGYIDALNHLQLTTSDTTSDEALLTEKYSNLENVYLKTDLNAINNAQPDDHGSKALVEAQSKYQTDQTTFNNLIATPQSLTEAFQNAVSDLAKATTAGFQNLGQLIQIWANLASISH